MSKDSRKPFMGIPPDLKNLSDEKLHRLQQKFMGKIIFKGYLDGPEVGRYYEIKKEQSRRERASSKQQRSA